jgi:VCBS repeat-containing protein
LNFAGKSGSHADFGPGAQDHIDGRIDSLSKGADTFTVPDAHLLFSGDYERSGTDLIVSDHLHRVVVPNYFHGDKRPTLVSPEGAPLDPKVIDALTGHVQYAQAGTAPAAKVVGHVVKMTGSASIVRNGVTIDVNSGDVVYQNDVVQTGSGSALGLVMIDGTTFNLTANARLMMNDLTYDAASTSNTSLFTLVQGAATFVAGQVAKTGDMKVSTPVATMGIRGTAVILDVSSIDGTVSVSVVNQRDGQVHAVQVLNARGDLIGMVTSNGSSLTLTPTASFEVIAQESNKTVAQVLTEFNAFQQLLSTYEIGKQLVPNTPFPTDGRRGDNTQQPLTKFAGSTISPIDSTTTKFNADIASTKDAKSGAGTDDAATLKPTGDGTVLVTKVAVTIGDAPVQFVNVSATSVPFVVTPSPVSRISSGPGDHFGPVMSADGQFVTYDPDGAIYLFDRQTGATKTVASPDGGFTYGSPTISSDGHFVVYQGSDGTQSWIFIYNNDASDPAHYGQTTRLMSGGQAAISGDGSKLVVERGGSIGLYDQQGHELANITGAAVGITGTLWKPAISADGHIIAFWSSDLSSPGGAGQLFTYDLSTATVRSIASTATDAGNSAASFSADGHYVVYQSDAPGGHSEIYLYDLRAGEVVFHTSNPQPSYNPVLSPDGHFIILTSDARLTPDDRNSIADVYVIDVTDPSHPVYKLVSALDDGTQGDDASNLGAAISAGGQFIAFGSRASNFSSGDTPGTGDIFVVDPTSGHSAIILESRNSPAVLGTGGVIKLTGDHSGVTLGVSDSRLTASFDDHGDIQWSFNEPRSDFASLQPGQISVLNFVITLSTDRSTTEIPVKVSIYDVDQPAVSVADAAPVAGPVTLAAGTEDTGYTISAAALLAGVVDIDGPSLSITAVGVISGGGTIVDNHDGSFSYTPAPDYNGPVVFSYTASDGTLSASSTATLAIAGVNDAPVFSGQARGVPSVGVGNPVLIVTNVSASDVDSDNYNGGSLTASVTSGARFGDTLSLAQHTQSIFLDGSTVMFDPDGTGSAQSAVAIGTLTLGPALSALTVTLNENAGDAAVAALTEAIQFSTVSPDGNASPGTRTVTFTLTDGGHASTQFDATVDIAANQAPVAIDDSNSITAGSAAVHGNVLANDSDPEHQALIVSNVAHGMTAPQTVTVEGTYGELVIDKATGEYSYTLVTTMAQADAFRALGDQVSAVDAFTYTASDGALGDNAELKITVTGINDAPALTRAALNVSQGGTVVLGPSNIGVIDPDNASFTFATSGVSHGKFQVTTDGTIWVNATSFTTADLNAGHVRFTHDGSTDAPTFSIQADDGAVTNSLSNLLAGNVTFTVINHAPVIIGVPFPVIEGGTTLFTPAKIGITDLDSTSFTFTVSNVTHGDFQISADGKTWVDATTFTSADMAAGHVRFVHDGGEDAPTFSIQADDGATVDNLSNVISASIPFTNVNDAPTITDASLTISQGHTVTVTTADIDFVDPDSPVVTYTVSDLGHGHFEIGSGNDAVETETFTSADIVAGLVSFVDDGSSGTPTFSLTPNDGIVDGKPVDGVVTFSAANYMLTSTGGVTINVTPEGATSGFIFPHAGNVTTPGIPEDRIAIGYDVGGSHVVLDNAPLLGVHQMTSLSSETHSSGDTTFVSTTLDAGHDVTLVQTIALGDDANFFTTTIDITNNGSTDISNLRFLRNFDPDQDVQAHNDYNTLNDVVQKPDGAETFAIVSATGVESRTTVAMIGLGTEWRGSVFGFTNTDPFAPHAFDTPTDPNGAKADLSLSLTSSLGTLAAGDHVEVTYITTNNVATSGSNALYGTAGDDTINGLGGDDLLIGLQGADTFVFNAASGGSGHDTIADFTPGQDKISLDYHAFDANDPKDFANWLGTHATVSGSSDLLIDLNVDGLHPGVDTILLKNVALASLHAGDFHTV